MVEIERSTKELTAKHEVGHALLFIHNGLYFDHISVIPDDEAWSSGRVIPFRPCEDWNALLNMYFRSSKIHKIIKEKITEDLAISLEVNLAGPITTKYFSGGFRNISFRQFIDDNYEDLFEDHNDFTIITHLLSFREFPPSISFSRKRSYRNAYCNGLDIEAFWKSEYDEFPQDILIPFMALLLYYKSNSELMYNHLIESSKKVLNIIKSNENIIKYLADILLDKKKLTYKQFMKHYNAALKMYNFS